MVDECVTYGIQDHVKKLDWLALKDTHDACIGKLTQKYRQHLQDQGIDVVAGWAVLSAKTEFR